jgi:hypothetical protein
VRISWLKRVKKSYTVQQYKRHKRAEHPNDTLDSDYLEDAFDTIYDEQSEMEDITVQDTPLHCF